MTTADSVGVGAGVTAERPEAAAVVNGLIYADVPLSNYSLNHSSNI